MLYIQHRWYVRYCLWICNERFWSKHKQNERLTASMRLCSWVYSALAVCAGVLQDNHFRMYPLSVWKISSRLFICFTPMHLPQCIEWKQILGGSCCWKNTVISKEWCLVLVVSPYNYWSQNFFDKARERCQMRLRLCGYLFICKSINK